MTAPDFTFAPADPVEAAAAEWFARRDRGLSGSEQAAYLAWLDESPRHGETIARLEQVWRTLNPVFAEAVARGGRADPDMLAPAKRRLVPIWLPLLAAAAVAAFVFFRPHDAAPVSAVTPVAAQAIVHAAPERLVLADGSTVDLRDSAKVEVQFTSTERRIRLIRGEAFFTVAKNPARPLIVSADHVTVRAVGTAFSVSLGASEVSVLVTEGRVGVNELASSTDGNSAAAFEPAPLAAGQKGVISLAAEPADSMAFSLKTSQLTPEQIERALLWQGVRLEFADLPLSAIAAAFNRFNRTQLVIGDEPTAAIRMGGSFRADHVADFVRLLGTGFGVTATPQGDDILLRQPHAR